MEYIGLLGCGSIGSSLANSIVTKSINGASLLVLFDQDIEKARELSTQLGNIPFTDSFHDFIGTKDLSMVVEAASQQAIFDYGNLIVASGKNLLMMSTGALLSENLFADLNRASQTTGVSIYAPSGAVGGIDAIKAAKDGLQSVTLTTRKPPRSLSDTSGIDLENIDRPTTVFDGNAVEAVKRFPFNINVAATISLAGLGPENTRVIVIADPNANGNIHEIEVIGESGRMKFTMENVPHPKNHMTSYLAVLSAIETLKRACGTEIQVGA